MGKSVCFYANACCYSILKEYKSNVAQPSTAIPVCYWWGWQGVLESNYPVVCLWRGGRGLRSQHVVLEIPASLEISQFTSTLNANNVGLVERTIWQGFEAELAIPNTTFFILLSTHTLILLAYLFCLFIIMFSFYYCPFIYFMCSGFANILV